MSDIRRNVEQNASGGIDGVMEVTRGAGGSEQGCALNGTPRSDWFPRRRSYWLTPVVKPNPSHRTWGRQARPLAILGMSKPDAALPTMGYHSKSQA